jgi:F-type H+-transporting ATPase subunit c
MDFIGYGIAMLGVSIGLGLIGYSALQAMARQPEVIARLQVAMLIAFAFVELVFLLTLFIAPNSLRSQPAASAPVSASATP